MHPRTTQYFNSVYRISVDIRFRFCRSDELEAALRFAVARLDQVEDSDWRDGRCAGAAGGGDDAAFRQAAGNFIVLVVFIVHLTILGGDSRRSVWLEW